MSNLTQLKAKLPAAPRTTDQKLANIERSLNRINQLMHAIIVEAQRPYSPAIDKNDITYRNHINNLPKS